MITKRSDVSEEIQRLQLSSAQLTATTFLQYLKCSGTDDDVISSVMPVIRDQIDLQLILMEVWCRLLKILPSLPKFWSCNLCYLMTVIVLKLKKKKKIHSVMPGLFLTVRWSVIICLLPNIAQAVSCMKLKATSITQTAM